MLCSIASGRPTPRRTFLASYTDNLLVEVKKRVAEKPDASDIRKKTILMA